MELKALVAASPADRQLHALLSSRPDFSWQMLPTGVGSDDGEHVSEAYLFLLSLVMSLRSLPLASGALLSRPCQPPPPHGRCMLRSAQL